jgi:hypothetical protein
MSWKSIMPFPPEKMLQKNKKVLGNFSLRRFEFGFSTIEFGFLVFVKGKTHKIIFFYPPWLQASVSLILAPTLFFSFSMFGNVPAAKNSSTLSCNSANSLFFVSSICAFSCHQQLPPNSIRFCKLARQKRQKVFPKCTDSGSSRSFPLLP